MSDNGLNFGMSDGRIVITEPFPGDDALGEANTELRFLQIQESSIHHPPTNATRCGKFVWYFTGMIFQPPAEDSLMILPHTRIEIDISIPRRGPNSFERHGSGADVHGSVGLVTRNRRCEGGGGKLIYC
jgi:hypothetical protein